MDTRSPRGLSVPEPVLNTVKVPCDPAQVVVNHVSFRVLLPAGHPVSDAVTLPFPSVPRRRPLVWTGRSAPGNPGATTLLRAVADAAPAAPAGSRAADRGAGPGRSDAVATQVLPRVGANARPRSGARPGGDDGTLAVPVLPRGPRGAGHDGVVSPRAPMPGEMTQPLPAVDHPGTGVPRAPREPGGPRRARAADGRQAFYPGRRLSLGVVLLPLRMLLGFISLYAGMGKLTDPVYFDGGERGSLYAWLSALQPWSLASPLHDWALAHPVGAGLTVAFTQIIIGVLTLCGLWQRLAATLGALLSLALLLTVSWQHGPAYDTPDVIFFAAWTPLVIAGAPVYSLDARLAGEAWRTLGPRAPLSELRRRVLRRGSMLAALLLGLALLIGSMLGSAVRSSQLPQLPGPGEPPINHLPGQPLPGQSAGDRPDTEPSERARDGGRPTDEAPVPGVPEPAPGGPATGTGAAPGTVPEEPTASEQTVPAPQPSAVPEQVVPQEPPPAQTPPPSSSHGGASPSDDGGEEHDGGGEESSPGPIGGLLGY